MLCSTSFASPRRLGVHVQGVAAKAADRALQQKLMPAADPVEGSPGGPAAYGRFVFFLHPAECFQGSFLGTRASPELEVDHRIL
ncbi:MAG TPA: hypothetical protein VIP05_23560, partial [Burkholderiaceae bacterium]